MKITKQTLKKIIREELESVLSEQSQQSFSKSDLAAFFKKKHDYLLSPESQKMNLSSSEIQVVADIIDKMLRASGSQSDAAKDITNAADELDDSPTGSDAAEQEKETIVV